MAHSLIPSEVSGWIKQRGQHDNIYRTKFTLNHFDRLLKDSLCTNASLCRSRSLFRVDSRCGTRMFVSVCYEELKAESIEKCAKLNSAASHIEEEC